MLISQYTTPNLTIEAPNGTSYSCRRYGNAGAVLTRDHSKFARLESILAPTVVARLPRLRALEKHHSNESHHSARKTSAWT